MEYDGISVMRACDPVACEIMEMKATLRKGAVMVLLATDYHVVGLVSHEDVEGLDESQLRSVMLFYRCSCLPVDILKMDPSGQWSELVQVAHEKSAGDPAWLVKTRGDLAAAFNLVDLLLPRAHYPWRHVDEVAKAKQDSKDDDREDAGGTNTFDRMNLN